MKKIYYVFLLIFLYTGCFSVLAQQDSANVAATPAVDHSYKPLLFRLNDDGSKYLRLIMWHQFWIRAIENNPGTYNVAGELSNNSYDIGLRRSRLLALAQISPRFLILTHFGINNHTFANGGIGGNKKPALFVHDAWTEYMVVKNKLYLGAGLHYWNGISRMTNASTLNFMTLDAPIFNWPNIEMTDQFARQYGIYAKGKLGKLDYRMALNKPFTVGGPAVAGKATNRPNDELAWQGYFNYQFKDQESNLLPFMVGTYLGSKEIFNIGVGFHHHPNATSRLEYGSEKQYDIVQLGADVFYEKPIGKMAISAYSAFYSYDFGPGYIRNIGIMNVGQLPPANASVEEPIAFNGPGNAEPMIGTGTISYTQLGLLLPRLKNDAQFMPYITFTRKNFDALLSASNQYDVGLNYFINGHNAKITAQYSVRPIYNTNRIKDGNAGAFVLQTHIFL